MVACCFPHQFFHHKTCHRWSIVIVILWCDAFYRGDSPFFYVVPWGLRRTLCWLKERYSNPVVYVTENGFSDSAGTTDDHDRIDYLRRHIDEVLKGKCSVCHTISTETFRA